MLTFLVLLNGSPSTRAIQEHLASLPSKDEANPTIIQIMRQERNYYRQLKVWKMRLTSCIPALGMLTLPVVSLSKPVGPKFSKNTLHFQCLKTITGCIKKWAFAPSPVFLPNGFKDQGFRSAGLLAVHANTWYLPLSLTQNATICVRLPRL